MKANAALVHNGNLPATFDSLTVRARCTPIELQRLLDAPPGHPISEVDDRFRPKFSECLPDELIAEFANQRLYDWTDGKRTLEMRIVQVPLFSS